MHFEWDPAKDLSNQRKHGVSFEEARRLFESGVDYLEIYDAEHSEVEDRFLAIGPIDRGIVVVVMHGTRGRPISNHGRPPGHEREQNLYYTHKDRFR